MIRLKKGDIFNTKCDLLIIPCNNYGGLSYSVSSRVISNNIPMPDKTMSPGDVTFIEAQSFYNNSNYIGFAASVDVSSKTSSIKILNNVFKNIILFATENDIRNINLPLLGTGAGQLNITAVVKEIMTVFSEQTDLIVTIFAYSSNDFQIASREFSEKVQESIKSPRVFISYSSADLMNRNWTLQLVSKLRKNGVDAIIDVYNLKPGFDLPQWMTNEIIKADKVLLICDSTYVEKSDLRNGGVGWEAMIIQGDMMWNSQKKNKYIVIAREEKIDTSIPIYIRSKYAFHWPATELPEDEFKKLLLAVFDCEIQEKLGDVPDFIIQALTSAQIN